MYHKLLLLATTPTSTASSTSKLYDELHNTSSSASASSSSSVSSVFSRELTPIQSYSNKWDHIRQKDEEDRLRDSKNLREPTSDSHIVILITVLALVTLFIIILIKCVCERNSSVSTWFNSKYRPGTLQVPRRPSQTGFQNVESGGAGTTGTAGSADPSAVSISVVRGVTTAKPPPNNPSPRAFGPGTGKEKKSFIEDMREEEDASSANPYAPTTTTSTRA